MTGRRPVAVAREDLAAAFTEWDRRYREEPERFMSDVEHLLGNTSESYGDQAAAYLIALMNGELDEPSTG